MKNTLIAAVTLAATALTSAIPNVTDARLIREDGPGGYDYAIMKSVVVPREDAAGPIGDVSNEFASFYTEIEDREDFMEARFDGKRKAILHTDEDRLMIAVTGINLSKDYRETLEKIFVDIEEGDFDKYNQGFTFAAIEKEKDGEEVTSLVLALLGTPGAGGTVAAADADRIRVRVNSRFDIALPPATDVRVGVGMDRTGAGVTTFTAYAELPFDDALQAIADSYREAGHEPVITKSGPLTSVSVTGEGFRSNFNLTAAEVDSGEPPITIVQGTTSSSD